MGVDTTAVLGYGYRVECPHGTSNEEEVLEAAAKTCDLQIMTAGSRWSGDLEYYAVVKSIACNRAGAVQVGEQIVRVSDGWRKLDAFKDRHLLLIKEPRAWWLGTLFH